jgi:hypothetical protein
MKSVVKQVHPNQMNDEAFWEVVDPIYTTSRRCMAPLVRSKVETPVMRVVDFPSGSSAKILIKVDLYNEEA